MTSYTYLIIGGGMTAAAAIAGIREVDREGKIAVIGDEPHRPYNRPPLSKGLWKGEDRQSVWREIKDPLVTFHLGRTVKTLDLAAKQVTDDQGKTYSYKKLLLATGCAPRRLAFGQDQIIYFRTLTDYDRLRELTKSKDHFAVIGGGFIGSEMAAALAMNNKKVTMIFPDEFIGSKVYPAEFASHLTSYFREKDVEVLAGTKVTGCESKAGKSVLKLIDSKTGKQRELSVDGVVAGIGVMPNVQLAQDAGLEVDNGIRVNSTLRTSHNDVYAAGDVASFYNSALGRWMRVEHEDNANTMGRLAGVAMAGGEASYDYLPLFYTDLFELGYEAVGDVDSRHETFIDWHDPKNKTGVIYYLCAGKVCGAVLCNLFGKVDEVRQIIQQGRNRTAADLRGAVK